MIQISDSRIRDDSDPRFAIRDVDEGFAIGD
jgi:hypothetical protein